MSQKGNVSEFVKDIPKELILIQENEQQGFVVALALCEQCSAKIDEHFKFCAECGSAVNVSDKHLHYETDLYADIQQEIKMIPLKYGENLDDHIYQAKLLNHRAYERWTNKEDELLSQCCDQFSIEELSHLFGRSAGGIQSRLMEL